MKPGRGWGKKGCNNPAFFLPRMRRANESVLGKLNEKEELGRKQTKENGGVSKIPWERPS